MKQPEEFSYFKNLSLAVDPQLQPIWTPIAYRWGGLIPQQRKLEIITQYLLTGWVGRLPDQLNDQRIFDELVVVCGYHPDFRDEHNPTIAPVEIQEGYVIENSRQQLIPICSFDKHPDYELRGRYRFQLTGDGLKLTHFNGVVSAVVRQQVDSIINA